MRKIRALVLALLLSVITTPFASAADTCSKLNVPSLADDNLTVTVTNMTTTEKTGSLQLTINYKMVNGTSDKKIDEGSFKIFYTDGTSEPQYGFFGTFFPGDSKERSHTWEYLKSKTPMSISYNAGFFSSAPSESKLNWAPPGQICNLVSPAVKAAADKAAADKAAADKAAAEAKASAVAAAAEAKASADLAIKILIDQVSEFKSDLILRFNALAKKYPAEKNKLLGLSQSLIQLGTVDTNNYKLIESSLYIASGQADAIEEGLLQRRTTITCVKGKLTKKVTAINPKCPSGYKKK